MIIHIVHDSQHGNGKSIADAMAAVFSADGHSVQTHHQSEIDAREVLSDAPGLLVIGSAVRAFMISPKSKSWIGGIASGVRGGARTPKCALFVTHAMKREGVEQRVSRLQKRLRRATSTDHVYPEWLSGRVKDVEGPLEEGALEAAAT